MNLWGILLAAGPLSFFGTIITAVVMRKKTSADTAKVLTETSGYFLNVSEKTNRKLEVRMNRCERVMRTQSVMLDEWFTGLERTGSEADREKANVYRIRLEKAEEWTDSEQAVLAS